MGKSEVNRKVSGRASDGVGSLSSIITHDLRVFDEREC